MSSALLSWNPVAMPSSGLIGHWKMNGDALDSSTQGKNGTETSMSYVAGRLDKAGSFNGTSSRIDIGDQAVYDFGASGGFSVAIWCKTAGDGSTRDLIRKRDTGDGWEMQKRTDNRVNFRVTGSNTAQIATTQSINDNNWHLIIGIQDRSITKIRIYFDGSFSAELTDNSGSLANAISLLIGAGGTSGSPINFWSGQLDDARIYNRVLNAYEISQLYAVEIVSISAGALT